MTIDSAPDREYIKRKSDWVDLWEVMADPVRFAAKFNATVPAAYRLVSAEDIRYMSHCGLIGRYGFFTQEDLETVRGILSYEQLREREAEHKKSVDWFIRHSESYVQVDR